MLKAIIIGHLGQDASIKTFGDASYVTFSVAHSDKYKDATGAEHESTQWVSCMKRVYGNSQLVNYLTKGTRVYCEGGLSAKMYTNQSNTSQIALNLRVTELELLSVKTEPSFQQPERPAQPERPTTEKPEINPEDLKPVDDLPF